MSVFSLPYSKFYNARQEWQKVFDKDLQQEVAKITFKLTFTFENFVLSKVVSFKSLDGVEKLIFKGPPRAGQQYQQEFLNGSIEIEVGNMRETLPIFTESVTKTTKIWFESDNDDCEILIKPNHVEIALSWKKYERTFHGLLSEYKLFHQQIVMKQLLRAQ